VNILNKLKIIGIVDEVDSLYSKIKIFPEYCKGLEKLEDYSHIIVLYWFHKKDDEEHRNVLQVIPKRHFITAHVGVFASRSPSRPNPIGLCVVKLLNIEDCILEVEELDALEGSPVIDIKPYLPRADSISEANVPEWAKHGSKT
jgi:tRNA-Thr(GGU) m(6)t(6)A37 methyltransferase TsaA